MLEIIVETDTKNKVHTLVKGNRVIEEYFG